MSDTPMTDAASYTTDWITGESLVRADFARGLERQLAEAQGEITAMRNCENCKHDLGGLFCSSKKKCYNSSTDTVSLDGWEVKARGK